MAGRPRITPGKRLVRALDTAVAERGLDWSEVDVAMTLPLIEVTADRVEVLRSKLAEEVDRDGPVAVRAVQLASELRQLEAQLSKLVAAVTATLDEDDEPAAPKSARHVAAARTRWDARSHRQKPVA